MQTSVAPAVIDSLDGLGDTDVLAVLEAGVARLRGTSFGGSVGDDAVRDRTVRLQRIESGVHAEKLRTIAEVESRKAFRGVRQRSTADWLADACGLSKHEARRQAETADALSRLPHTAAALADGTITPGHADTAARGLGELDEQAELRRRDAGGDVEAWADAVEDGEALAGLFDQMVADEAANKDKVELKKQVDSWTSKNDPDVIVQRDRRAWRRRGLWFDDTADADGLYGLAKPPPRTKPNSPRR